MDQTIAPQPSSLRCRDPERQAVLRRFPPDSRVRYDGGSRIGTVIGTDTAGTRLLLRRDDVRDGEWERVAVALAEVDTCNANAA
jgi:hypothetical protein